MNSTEPALQLQIESEKYVVRHWTPKDQEPLVKIVQASLASSGGQFKPEGRDKDLMHVEEYYWKNDRAPLKRQQRELTRR